MDIENQEDIYCVYDDAYRVSCNVSDKLCFKRFYENHLKSGTHINIIQERQSFHIILLNEICRYYVSM